MKNMFENKIILITGGVGSIGSEIVKQLLAFKPKQIRVFDNRETESFHMQHELFKYSNLRFLIGDVRDKERLFMAMENADIVFHAGALKHVPSCEFNPFEAVKTNVNGTQNVIEAALAHNVEKVINISTDKVTNTINTMGATKLLAERLITAAQYYKGNKRTKFCSVRFGNVIASRGSVIDLFKRQIEHNGQVTITHPEMTRFIMTIPEAVSLVLKASEQMNGGETFILKMPAFRLKDLSEVVIDEYAKKMKMNPKSISMKIIGLRPGEKMHESLMTIEEAENAVETKDMFIVISKINIPYLEDINKTYAKTQKARQKSYESNMEKPLSKEQLKDFLLKEHLI